QVRIAAHPEVGPQVDGGVVDRQVRVVDGGDPGAVRVGAVGHGPRQLGVSGEVVGHAAHAARQLLGGEQPGAAVVGGDDELDRGGPVGVEDDDGVVVVHPVEHVGPQPPQPVDEGEVLAAVQLAADGLRQDDRGDVGEEPGADYFSHGAVTVFFRSQ